MVLPLNAHLDFSGNEWVCDDGYQKQRGVCVVN
jgi:hypothetical protein